MCKHMGGIPEEYCHICNGSYDRAEMAKMELRDEKVRKKKWAEDRKQLQNESKEFAINHKKPFTDEEIMYIVNNTEDVEKTESSVLFNIAKHLKRRLGAIEWIWNFAWDENVTEYDTSSKDGMLYQRVCFLKDKALGKEACEIV